MKKIFTLCAAVLMSGAAAMAQVDNTFSIVDAEGNVIEDGATITVTEIEDDMFLGPVIHSGLSVRNNTSEDAYCRADINITQISEGTSYQTCIGGACIPAVSTVGLHYSEASQAIPANEVMAFADEWMLIKDYNPITGGTVELAPGSMTATFTLKKLTTPEKFDDETHAPGITGPSVTIRFVNENTTQGIDGVSDAEGKQPVAYYSLDGRRLPVAQKGLNIVKNSDGSTRKVVVK